MRLKTFAIFILTLIMLGACTSELEEVVDSTYPEGSKKVIKYYKNEADKQILVKETGYYPDGNNQFEGCIDNDKRHGKWTYWYKNGNLWSEGSFNHGLNDGLRTTYHENGKIYYQGKYDDGKRVGKWKFYDEDGKFVKDIEY